MPHEIDEYVKHTTITGWIIELSLDLEQIVDYPFFKQMEGVLSTYLGTEQFDRNIITLSKSYLRTYDSWFGFGSKTLSENFY